MHYLYANFINILEIRKQFFQVLIIDKGKC